MNIMEKSKIYFTIGIVGVQCGAVAIHWGLGLIFLGALFLLFSYIKFEKHQENDDESNILELPSEAPHGAIWPWNGKQYIRIGNTWVQLEEYSINNNYKNQGTMIKKAELASISTFVGAPPFHNDMNILINMMIDGKLITHTHCLPHILASIFKDLPCIHRQEIAKMFAHEIVREIKLDNCLEFGEIDMSDVFEVIRLKYPMLVMSFLDGIHVSQNFCTE